MIFKTIDDNDSLSGQRIVSKFTARKIAQEEATKQLEIDIQCLRNYEAECQKGSVSTETFSNTMKGASIEAQKYATNIKNGTGSAQTFATNQRTIQASMSETSIVSKVAATGLSIFKAALNSLIFFAVIEGIQLLIKRIDNLILTADEAEEKAEAIRGNMQSFFDEVQSGQQTISSVSDRFSELSEHVTKTGENIDLTKDEYSEYLDICNQVKTIMPELVTGYTNEGNAIITLKDNVNSLTESYKENIRAKAAAFITNGDDDGNTIQSFFDDYKIFTEGENGLFAPSAGGLWNNKSTDYEDYYGYDKVHEWLEDVANLSLKDLQNLQKGTTQATYLYALLKENGYELANITEDNYEAVHDVLDTRLTSLEGEMATRVSNVKMSLQQMLYADRDYWDIDDKEALSAIDSFFASIDDEFIKQNNLLSQTALQSFESNAVDLFQNKSTKQSMIDIFSPQGEDESIKDYTTRVENAISEIQKYCDENGITISFNFGTEDNPKGIQESVDKLQDKYDATINRFKSDTSDSSSKELDSLNKQLDEQTQSLADAKENLQNEYDKISDWGLDDYADQIKNGTLPSQFGNVDMDNRQIIDWNIDNIEKWKDALSDIKYYDKDGNFIESYYNQLEESAKNGESCIDTVFGDLMDKIEGYGDITALSFSHVVNNDDGTFEFLGQKTAEEYLYGILDVAKKDGDMSIDHVLELDKKGFENAEVYDAQGKVIGETYIHGIISGFNENAADISSLTHFAGKDGAIQIAQSDIDTYNKQIEETKKKIEEVSKGFDDSQKIKDFFDTEGINTDEEINDFNKVTEGINRADEAIQKWNEHKKQASSNPDLTSLLTESDDKSQTANLADLQSEADLLSTIQKELDDNGRIGVSSMQSIIKKYPKAKAALSDYMQGIISEQELFSQLETIYENDKNQYIQSVVDKSQTDEEFFNAVMTNYPELYNELSSLYGNDVDNWSNMEQAKLEITNKAIKELAGVWSDYFKVVSEANGKLMVQTTGWYDAGMYSADPDEVEAMDEEYNNMYNHFQSIVDGANAAVDALNNYSFKQVSSSINVDWKGMSGYDSSDSSSSSSGSDSSSSSEPSPQDFNWVERLLSKISKAYDRLKNKVSDTTRTWLNRNNALSDSMETLLSEINAQSSAYDFYMDRFNSYDLDGYYKDQIANGSFSIETIYDDDLKEAISDCQDLYDKAQDAADSVQSLNIEIRQLAKSRFDNIQSQFEEVLGKVNSIKDLYSKDNDLLEEQGWFASTLLNNSMMEQEQKNLEKLEQERDALTKALNSAMESGKIEAESEDWYSMQSAIDDCTSSIYDAKKALVEYDNAIRQINWDAFDKTRDDVSNLIDETQFLVDLLKDEDITDDNGNMNDNGKAAQALIAQKYQLYLNQAKAYKDEILKINEELANDPYDKELLDRKQELIKAQQEAINSSISEKDALKDLVQEGYDSLIDKLQELIDARKDALSAEKDLYDYQKSIAEQTKTITQLRKQLIALSGDNSEATQSKKQSLSNKLDEAEQSLSDSEYEQYIQDQQAMMDSLMDNIQDWVNGRLDDIDGLMQSIIDSSNENASNISQTITDTAESYGYKLSESMSSIWSLNANNITNGINSVLGDFSNKFVEGNNAINKVCGDINAAVQGLLKNSNDEAQRVADEIARQQAEQNANTDGGYSDGGGSSDDGGGSSDDGGGDDWSDNWDNSDSGSSDDGGGSWGDWFYHLEDDYPKDLLEVD